MLYQLSYRPGDATRKACFSKITCWPQLTGCGARSGIIVDFRRRPQGPHRGGAVPELHRVPAFVSRSIERDNRQLEYASPAPRALEITPTAARSRRPQT